MREETGLRIDEAAWKRASYATDNRSYVSYVMVATSSEVRLARQLEEEEVEILSLDHCLKEAVEYPQLYAPDFLQVVGAAKATLNIP